MTAPSLTDGVRTTPPSRLAQQQLQLQQQYGSQVPQSVAQVPQYVSQVPQSLAPVHGPQYDSWQVWPSEQYCWMVSTWPNTVPSVLPSRSTVSNDSTESVSRSRRIFGMASS
jgi:hypothetical protein